SGSQIPRVEIEPDMKSMLPPGMESKINTDKIDDMFGGTEMLIVTLKAEDVLEPQTLRRARALSRGMKRIPGVDKVLSLFELKDIKPEGGAMVVRPAVRSIPRNAKEKEELRQEIRDNDLVFGNVVSEDFTVTAIIALLKTDVSDDFIISRTEALIAQNHGEEEVAVSGLPFIRFQVTKSIKKDLRRLLPTGILVMLVFLFFCFRQLMGVLLPFLVVVMSILFAMGLIPVLGWKIHVITVLLPVMMIAIANDYGIHLIARYQEMNTEGNPYSPIDLARSIFQSLRKPVLLTGLTTVAGILCLMGHVIIPARQLSILASAGIIYALSASLFFIPAVMSFLPKAKPVIRPDKSPQRRWSFERLLRFFGDVVSGRPGAIVAFAFVSALLVSAGSFLVVVDTDPVHYYPSNHPVVTSSNLVNQKLGGIQNVSLVFEGDIKEPRMMKKIDLLEKRIRNIPKVGNTSSIARVVRKMSRALHEKSEEGYDRIPDTRNAVAQYFMLYAMSGDPEDFEKMVDFPYEHALLTARIASSSTSDLSRIVKRIEDDVKADPDVMLVGGFGLILSEIARVIVEGQFLSLALALAAIGILIGLLFRSFAAGWISAIPLALSIMTLFGLMGVFGLELNITTAMLSSIMIGVGVDYTIHFLWRYREERRRGLAPREAVRTTLVTTGRGIVFNGLSVIVGFVVLFSSSFLPVRFFGFLVMVSIFSCLIGALVLVPSLCLVLRPRFLEPSGKKPA
ncbi:MAG: RND family transporter, partial [Candidatus Aminicenantales bacterium]